jgi:hypothetical protein
MGLMTMCPACGSDWCSNCQCVRDQLALVNVAYAELRGLVEEIRMDFAGAVATAVGMCKRFGGKFVVYHYPSQPDQYRISRPDVVPVEQGAVVDAELLGD